MAVPSPIVQPEDWVSALRAGPGRDRAVAELQALLLRAWRDREVSLAPELWELVLDELDRYVGLQLRGRDAEAAVPGMAAHLRGCPACSEEHAGVTALLIDGSTS